MMRPSILTGGLPETVTVNGISVPIETDYRLGLLTGMMAADPDLTDPLRLSLLLRLYCHQVPDKVDPEALAMAILDFYAMDPQRHREHMGNRRPSEPVYDFTLDGDRIFASFLQAYGIDLTAVRMHWWKFMTLLLALPEDTVFMQTVRLRTMDLHDIADEGLRRKLRQARNAVRIRKTHNEKGEDTAWQTEV